jgi:hypothetical protein
MRPDIDPATGELAVLLLIMVLAWVAYGLTEFRRPK